MLKKATRIDDISMEAQRFARVTVKEGLIYILQTWRKKNIPKDQRQCDSPVAQEKIFGKDGELQRNFLTMHGVQDICGGIEEETGNGGVKAVAGGSRWI